MKKNNINSEIIEDNSKKDKISKGKGNFVKEITLISKGKPGPLPVEDKKVLPPRNIKKPKKDLKKTIVKAFNSPNGFYDLKNPYKF